MPQLFRIGGYLVYFWSDESKPLEPVHVHVTKGKPTKDATKIWITQDGHALLCHNKSKIPAHTLSELKRVIEANSHMIIQSWFEHFQAIRYYC